MAVAFDVLVGVGLALEGDIAVGLEEVAIDDEPDQPFRHIPQEESHKQHLPLLHGVDTLMPRVYRRETRLGKDDAAEVYGEVFLAEGYVAVVDNRRTAGLVSVS